MTSPESYFETTVWQRILAFAKTRQPPFLVIDLPSVAAKQRALSDALPEADIYYALKANPTPEIVRLLDGLGCGFELASPQELELCLDLGIAPDKLCFGNTVKSAQAIARFYAAGVRLYASDSAEDIQKIAKAAPGARVYVRIMVEGSASADWPLDRKFGCRAPEAVPLMELAATLGLQPAGISFHVGSQQNDPAVWRIALAEVRTLFSEARAAGLSPDLINIGGGLPARYLSPVPEVTAFAEAIRKAIQELFPETPPRLIMEPGRYLVAEAGVLVSEVMLATRKPVGGTRWIYLDTGVFGGLTESLGEATKYPIWTEHEAGKTEEVILAGPTCDGRDILYDNYRYQLPLALKDGDRVYWLATGGYTVSCGSSGYNGFPPLTAYCLGQGES